MELWLISNFRIDFDSYKMKTFSFFCFGSIHNAGNMIAARALIEYNADVNATDASGSTPLHLALKFGNTYINNQIEKH